MYPAGEAGIAARRVSIGGVNLRVLESGPASGDAIVLVHGWGGSVYTFAETIPALAAAGYRVLALDLPGFGLSDKPTDDRQYTTEALSDAVLGAIRGLGVERYVLMGHSMGGALSLHLACRRAPGLRALVLANAVGLARVPVMPILKALSPRAVNRLTPHLLPRWLVRLILRTAFGTRARPTDRDVDEYWAPTQWAEYAWACRACAHHVTWKRVGERELQRLDVPVLVIAGGRDPLVRGSAARARAIPHAHVVRVDEGGHLALQECAPRVNAEVIAFLRAHLA